MTHSPASSSLQPEQRAALRAAKLDALVDRHWGHDPARERWAFGEGAASVVPGAGEGVAEAWVHPVGFGLRTLGAALIWSARHQVRQLHVLVDSDGGEAGAGSPTSASVGRDLARRATYVAAPEVRVWIVPSSGQGPPLVAPDPAPLRARREPQPAEDLVDLLLDAGTEIVLEGGMIRAEVNGLEVARIVHGETTAGVPVEGAYLEVGVGAADRELSAAVHGQTTPSTHLDGVVELVRSHRRAGAPPHPLNRLVPERWLRARAVREPGLVDMAAVKPSEGPHPRVNLTATGPAIAEGRAEDGTRVVLAFSVGTDVDLVPAAADARAQLDPAADLWLVVPERDDHSLVRRLAGQLTTPARVVTVPDDWPA